MGTVRVTRLAGPAGQCGAARGARIESRARRCARIPPFRQAGLRRGLRRGRRRRVRERDRRLRRSASELEAHVRAQVEARAVGDRVRAGSDGRALAAAAGLEGELVHPRELAEVLAEVVMKKQFV